MADKFKGTLWAIAFFMFCFFILMPIRLFAEPVSRNTDKIKKGVYRVYSAPVNYKTPQGKFEKIDLAATTSTATTLSRNKGVVKALFCDRQVTFTPDEGQWSLVVRAGTQTLTGIAPIMITAQKPIVKPGKPDRTEMDGDKFEVNTTAQGSKFLIPSTDKVTDFSCQFILTPSKGLELVYKDGQVWFEYRGKVALRIGEPKLLDTDLNTLGELDQNLVDFTLVDSGHGTWTYTKIPGKDFAELKKPANYFIDADVVYGEQSGGEIYAGGAIWSTKHNQVNGDSFDKTGPKVYVGARDKGGGGDCYFRRLFLQIDLSAFENGGTIESATYHAQLWDNTKTDTSTQLAKSTADMSLVGAFATNYQKYGAAISDIVTTRYGWGTFVISDIAYVQDAFGGMWKYCHMDSRDLADSSPGVFNGINNTYPWFSGRIPYITLTGYLPPTPTPTPETPQRGFWSWKDNGFYTWP